MLKAIIRFFKWLFRIKDKPAPVLEPVVEETRTRLRIRRRTSGRAMVGPFLVPTGVYRTKEETAFLESRTPKGAHVITSGGARMHRKNRDILA